MQDHSVSKEDALDYLQQVRESLLDLDVPYDFRVGVISGILNAYELFGIISHKENIMIYESEVNTIIRRGGVK